MVQRSVVVMLLMMIVLVGCGEDEPKKVKPKVVDEVAARYNIIWWKSN
jgi:predicted component of type VI protein secretion system